jgi:hypothetical protein
MARKLNGGPKTKHLDYLKKILLENRIMFKYEAPLVLRAFKDTVMYFIDNLIEFKINDVFEFKRIHKKECEMYVPYKDDRQVVPAHDNMKFKVLTPLKDYLNSRNKFANVRHREQLPDGLTRNKNIF